MKLTTSARHILKDGKPWFYLGDTAWELFHRLTLDEAKEYLALRARQKYTVIQAVLLAEFNGLHAPNQRGHLPLQNDDPSKPDEGYFQDCDAMVKAASDLGLVMGLLPTWGDKWNKAWGVGPQVFTPENAFGYGAFVGRRYKDFPVIWILGGDRPIAEPSHLETVRAMAKGIRSVSPDKLMTFHPSGGASSSKFVHKEDWLDFNMMQSGHQGRDNPGARMIESDLGLSPAKPTLDGEPNYEDHPVMQEGWKSFNGWFDEFDVRKQAWRPMLAGACGHTYGCHDIWQFLNADRNAAVNNARTPWRKAAELPGANQMQFVRTFFESIAWEKLTADQGLFAGGPGQGADEGRAARADDGSWVALYVPTGREIRVNMTGVKPGLTASWYDPRTGARTPAGNGPWKTPTDADWVLYLG